MPLPSAIPIEEFRRLVRERQTLCLECGAIVEGVDKYRSPRAYGGAFNIECMKCGCDYVYGICELIQRRNLERPEPSETRRALEEKVFEGFRGSYEGKDEFCYVFVDGEYEAVDSMTDERLAALVWQLERMTPEHHEQFMEQLFEYVERTGEKVKVVQ